MSQHFFFCWSGKKDLSVYLFIFHKSNPNWWIWKLHKHLQALTYRLGFIPNMVQLLMKAPVYSIGHWKEAKTEKQQCEQSRSAMVWKVLVIRGKCRYSCRQQRAQLLYCLRHPVITKRGWEIWHSAVSGWITSGCFKWYQVITFRQTNGPSAVHMSFCNGQ